jgi:hypothetical protein
MGSFARKSDRMTGRLLHSTRMPLAAMILP